MTEAQRAHLRILEQSQLTVRTHSRHFGDYAARNSANNTRECVVNGVRYESLTEAARQLGCCREKIRKMILRGTARYV